MTQKKIERTHFGLKIIIGIIGLLLLILIYPLRSEIADISCRVESLEKVELNELRDEQNKLSLHLVEIRVRLEMQSMIIEKMADDLEYLRRRAEGE